MTPTEQSIRDECENALAWTTEKCPNAPYVPIKRETVERLIEVLARRIEAEAGPVAKTYPRMTWAANHKHTCNLCDPAKNPADGCNCGAALIDLIRCEMMSEEYPISEWEVQFAEKIIALPMFSPLPATPQPDARDARNAEKEAALRRVEDRAWFEARELVIGTNADMCRDAGAAYRLIIEGLTDAVHNRDARTLQGRVKRMRARQALKGSTNG